MGWTSPARLGPSAGAVLRFGVVPRLLCAVFTAGAAVGLLVAAASYHGADSAAPIAFLALFLAAVVATAFEVFGVAHRMTPDGLERVAPWRPRVTIRWSEVTAFAWSGPTRSYDLRARGGERIRVYEGLTGIAAFARAALAGAPAEVLDAQPGLRQRLEERARGIPPPIETGREDWHGG